MQSLSKVLDPLLLQSDEARQPPSKRDMWRLQCKPYSTPRIVRRESECCSSSAAVSSPRMFRIACVTSQNAFDQTDASEMRGRESDAALPKTLLIARCSGSVNAKP
eukprot:1369119-Amphidinium_carterae.2